MGIPVQIRFQQVPFYSLVMALLAWVLFCQNLWAAQEAYVIAEQAVIYADEQMTSPIGFVRRGKKVKVGEIPRNRAQVYPIVVSGKVAYIRVIDVSTEKESVDSTQLVAERFQRSTELQHKTNYSVSGYSYATQVNLDKENGKLKNKDPLNWTGVSLRGGLRVKKRMDIDFLINYMEGKEEDETFRAVETGLGGSLRIIDSKRLELNLLAQVLAVPFSSYSLGTKFRVNGYGFTTGGGLNMIFRFSTHWGIEAYGGLYYTQVMGFDVPKPYESISPSFVGNRLGLGLNYQF